MMENLLFILSWLTNDSIMLLFVYNFYEIRKTGIKISGVRWLNLADLNFTWRQDAGQVRFG